MHCANHLAFKRNFDVYKMPCRQSVNTPYRNRQFWDGLLRCEDHLQHFSLPGETELCSLPKAQKPYFHMRASKPFTRRLSKLGFIRISNLCFITDRCWERRRDLNLKHRWTVWSSLTLKLKTKPLLTSARHTPMRHQPYELNIKYFLQIKPFHFSNHQNYV